MKYLADFSQSRDNNFNLIRLLAALAVLFGHSYALLRQPEPLGASLGMSIGSIAVDLFFVTSGYLVTGSLMTRQKLPDYFLARVLRIFPGLICMVLLSVFALGAVFTSLPATSYFSSSATYQYLFKCASIVTGMWYTLPGLFEHNPYPAAVNGSLWTLLYELVMYALLAVFWGLHAYVWKRYRHWLARVLVLAFSALAIYVVRHHYLLNMAEFDRLFFMFFSGAAYFLLRKHIQLKHGFAIGTMLALVLSHYINPPVFTLAYYLSLPYLLLYLAYIPAGRLRMYNRVGDYSYGVYIYAFPIQQALLSLAPQMPVVILTVFATAFTMIFSISSWHVIEEPAMRARLWLTRRWKPQQTNLDALSKG